MRVQDVARALAGFQPRLRDEVEAQRKAAVAAILRQAAHEVEVLLIRRAEHPRDPWSGHMAFPGGRVDPADATPLAAAVRETREEVGLDLERDARLLGRLSDAITFRRAADVPAAIVPFVFELRGDPPLAINHEVQEAVWVPWSFLADEGNRSWFLWRRQGIPIPMPCYRYGGRVIWGLTLGMLSELVTLVRRVAS
jgi:8-oxo-dGTP pyrophosphatase MutT (NUDIX family)